jgi:hypothetical protein
MDLVIYLLIYSVEGLLTVPVASYHELERRIEAGTRNRTIAATNMNETSSRAHTIVRIHFHQRLPRTGTTKRSEINLVDLSGSERQKDAGTEGERFKEGVIINQVHTYSPFFPTWRVYYS